MKSILDYITIFKDVETYKGPGPRNMADGGMIGKPGGIVEPGVMYYGKKVKDMTSEERFLQNAQKSARNKGISGKQGSPEFEELLKNSVIMDRISLK